MKKFNIGKSVNANHCINRIKKEGHWIFPIDEEKTLDKIQYPLIVILSKLGIEKLPQCGKGHVTKTYS